MSQLSSALSIIFISLKLVKLRQIEFLSVAAAKGHETLPRLLSFFFDTLFERVFKGRRIGIFEVRHEHVGARIQRVDDHLAVDGPRDLDPAVAKVFRDRCDLPGSPAQLGSLLEKVRSPAGIELLLNLTPLLEKRVSAPAELAFQPGQEDQCLRVEDVLDAFGKGGEHLKALEASKGIPACEG